MEVVLGHLPLAGGCLCYMLHAIICPVSKASERDATFFVGSLFLV